MTPEERAQKSAAAMWANDQASPWLGMQLGQVGPGWAEVTLTVQDHHTNGHGTCHGGVIFSLADTAFAFACNSYNQATVAMHNSISFIAPGRVGQVLTARATEVSRQGRNGIYDVCVKDEDGQVIAEFRGCSRSIKGQNFDEGQGVL